ncbi:MAG: Hint domain-containing protein [Pseudomonadota bacterium]
MATYEFYIYNTDALGYNYNTGAFDFSSGYTPDTGRYRIVVSDDDATGHVSGDANQTAVVYDMAGNVVASGLLEIPAYAQLSGPSGAIYLDRFEVDGFHVGYASSESLTAGSSYPVAESSSNNIAYSYFEGNSIPCFVQNTEIETEHGPLDIADIVPGTLVQTLDHGLQAVLCHFVTPVSSFRLMVSPKLRPVALPFDNAGHKKLWVSRDHRVLMRHPLSGLYLGHEEVLAPAAGIKQRTPDLSFWSHGFRYHHLLFETHQIIQANGHWVESFFPGKEAMQRLSKTDRLKAEQILGDALYNMKTARPCLSVREFEAFLKIIKRFEAEPHSKVQKRNIRVAEGIRLS